MRDYAEQQQRLQQDIVAYSQRNRTAGIQREEEERQRRLEQELRTAMQEEDDAVVSRLTVLRGFTKWGLLLSKHRDYSRNIMIKQSLVKPNTLGPTKDVYFRVIR